jgi:hypothetical protein
MFGKKTQDFSEIHTQSLLVEVLRTLAAEIGQKCRIYLLRADTRSRNKSGIKFVELSGLAMLNIQSSDGRHGRGTPIRFKFIFPRDQTNANRLISGNFTNQRYRGAELSLAWQGSKSPDCVVEGFQYSSSAPGALGDQGEIFWSLTNLKLRNWNLVMQMRNLV